MKFAKASVAFTIFVSSAAAASGSGVSCGGYNTVLYSNDELALSICQGQAQRFSRSDLAHWQDCADAMILIRDKKHGTTTEYMDCTPTGRVQFMIRSNRFRVRHFYTEYPGFEMKPLLVESFNLGNHTKTYQFIKRFVGCNKGDVEAAKRQIDSAVAKPFDGKTYFPAVYGGFYKLRDCSVTKPGVVLQILQRYEDEGRFDGEVAETLDEVMDEADAISRAVQ